MIRLKSATTGDSVFVRTVDAIDVGTVPLVPGSLVHLPCTVVWVNSAAVYVRETVDEVLALLGEPVDSEAARVQSAKSRLTEIEFDALLLMLAGSTRSVIGKIVGALLDEESVARGYKDWHDAYLRGPVVEKMTRLGCFTTKPVNEARCPGTADFGDCDGCMALDQKAAGIVRVELVPGVGPVATKIGGGLVFYMDKETQFRLSRAAWNQNPETTRGDRLPLGPDEAIPPGALVTRMFGIRIALDGGLGCGLCELRGNDRMVQFVPEITLEHMDQQTFMTAIHRLRCPEKDPAEVLKKIMDDEANGIPAAMPFPTGGDHE